MKTPQSIHAAFLATLLFLVRPAGGFALGRRRRWSKTIQVSQARIPRDLDDIRQCRAAAFDASKPLLESQRNFLNATAAAAGRTTCFVARDVRSPFLSSPVLGTADVKFRNNSNHNSKACFINNVFVTTQARGRGIGKRLIQAVEEAARDQNVQSAVLEVYTSNTAAVALYRSCGYKTPGIHAVLAKLGEWMDFGFQIQMTKDLST